MNFKTSAHEKKMGNNNLVSYISDSFISFFQIPLNFEPFE